MKKQKEQPKVTFHGELNVARAAKMLLDLEASAAGMVPVDGTFRIYRKTEAENERCEN